MKAWHGWIVVVPLFGWVMARECENGNFGLPLSYSVGEMSVSLPLLRTRAKAALRCSFVGDSLSMPVHWYYNPRDITRAFPPHGVTKFEAAPANHPSSIMHLHSTVGGGRTGSKSAKGNICVVGDVILKDKARFWGKSNTHYHHGMKAGENTLNSHCALLLLRELTAHPEDPRFDVEAFATAYVEFMTADPAQHPDTYAESFHRGWFANWAQDVAPLRCGAVTHDTPSVGAFVMIQPLAITLLVAAAENGGNGVRLPEGALSRVQKSCRELLFLFHPDEGLAKHCDAFVALIAALLYRQDEPGAEPIRACMRGVMGGALFDKFPASIEDDSAVVGGRFSLACYITDSWPAALYLVHKYAADPLRGMLQNTNLGGENCHRGTVVGCLLGAASGQVPELYSDLALQPALDAALDTLFPASAAM